MKRHIVLVFLTGLILSIGCTSKSYIRPGDPIDVAFDKAKSLYDKKKYSEAAQAFETVLNMGRGTDFAQTAQFLLAESYYNNREYLIAASEYQRFVNYYPRSERRQEAQFKEALCYYNTSPRYKLDQLETIKAIELFQIFITRFPDSELTDEAGEYVTKLRSKLARKSYESAEMYLRVRSFKAAAIYYGATIDRFPDTIWADEALARQMLAYLMYADASVEEKQAERYQLALNSYQKYLQLFPNGKNRSLVEEYHDRARKGLQQARAYEANKLANSK